MYPKEPPLDEREAMLKQALMENARLKAQIESLRPPIPRTPKGAGSMRSVASTPTSQRSNIPASQASPASSVLATPPQNPASKRPSPAKTETEIEHGDAIAHKLRNEDHDKLYEQFDLSNPDSSMHSVF